jgi:hypothetical protein
LGASVVASFSSFDARLVLILIFFFPFPHFPTSVDAAAAAGKMLDQM